MRRLLVNQISSAQFDRYSRSLWSIVGRRCRRLTVPLIGEASLRMTLGLCISWLSIRRSVVLLENGTLKLGARSESTEAISLT